MHAMVCAAARLCVLALGAAGPQTQPAEAPWGTAKAGVQVSLSIPGAVRAGGKFSVDVAVRNVGAAAVELPQAKDVFGWLMLYYDRENAHVAQRVFPAAELGAGGWPASLEPDKPIRFRPIELSGQAVYSTKEKRRQVYTAYLKPDAAVRLPEPDGKLTAKLTPGKARGRFTLYLPRPKQSPLLLASNVVDLEIAPPQWSGLSAEQQKTFVAKLVAKFDRDAWAAMSAHGTAVAAGPGIVPHLIDAAANAKRPFYSRQWIATAIAKVRCAESVAWLIRMLDGRQGDVRQIVAYYGPTQHDAKLDEAIVAKAGSPAGRGIMARAVVGFLVFRRKVPEKLLAASFESKDPKVRTALAAALKGQASDFNVSRLVSLLADENGRVRSAAAKALGAMNRPSTATIGALIRSLQAPGDSARQSIAAALGRLTGREAPYDPKADAAARQKVLADWNAWWRAKVAREKPAQE